ncbi:MAG: acetyl-CoA acetyltransferase, partial [Thermodesulfobacteriota bacterium]
MKDRTCIVGVGTTEYGKRGEFYGRDPIGQIRGALDLALAESGLDRREIDGFSTYSVERIDPSTLAPALGIPSVDYSSMVHGGGGGGTCAAVASAAAAIVAGLARVVMVYKVITQPPHARFGASYGSAQVAADPA